MQHPAGTDMTTGRWVRASEERGPGGCHGNARWWRERIVHSGWHGTSCSVLNRSLSRLICLLGSGCWASLIRRLGTHNAFDKGRGVFFLIWMCVCGGFCVNTKSVCERVCVCVCFYVQNSHGNPRMVTVAKIDKRISLPRDECKP